ncbi:MAG: hypothetical protein MZU97_08955 [Bacillus subtilis]|nr:hypothetical protein [Bacillus subtilis]
MSGLQGESPWKNTRCSDGHSQRHLLPPKTTKIPFFIIAIDLGIAGVPQHAKLIIEWVSLFMLDGSLYRPITQAGVNHAPSARREAAIIHSFHSLLYHPSSSDGAAPRRY